MSEDLPQRDLEKDPVRPKFDVNTNAANEANLEMRDKEERVEGLEDEEDMEEAEVMKRKKEVRAPSREEIRVHRITHLPFRSWCAECVAGRAKDEAHHKRMEEDQEDSIKEVHFDYMMMRNEEAGTIAPVIVGRCRSSKFMIAHVMMRKGEGEEGIAQRLVRDTKTMGHYGPLVVKSDSEPSLLSVLERWRSSGTQK